MTTVILLERILANPLKVKRYSTRFIRKQIFSSPPTFPFPSEMLQEFSEILTMDAQREHPFITTEHHTEISPEKYDNLVEFLKALCSSPPEKSPNLTKAVLRAAVIFIERHPGSLLHEFMMLHQLRETLCFSGAEEYGNAMLIRKQNVLQEILQIHDLLEDTKHPGNSRMLRIKQALMLVSDKKDICLNARKVALLTLESYHLSSFSFKNKILFDARLHEIKNFRFIFELSSINSLDGLTETVSKVKFLPLTQEAISESFAVKVQERACQAVGFMGLRPGSLSQPKKLNTHWVTFFRRLETVADMTDPITLMASILNISPGPKSVYLQCWRQVEAESVITPLPENVISNQKTPTKEAVEEVLVELPPPQAPSPEMIDLPAQETLERKPANESERTMEFNRAELGERKPRPLAAIAYGTKQPKQQVGVKELFNISPIVEMSSSHLADTPASETSVHYRKKREEPISFADHFMGETVPDTQVAEEIQVNALQQEGFVNNPNDQSSADMLRSFAFEENEENEENDYSDMNSDAGGGGRASDTGSVLTYMSEIYDGYDVKEFSPHDSTFATDFIELLLHANTTKSVQLLIDKTLTWFKKAKKCGVNVQAAPYAANALENMKKSKKELSLEDAYEHLYALLQAMVFSSRLRNADKGIILPYFQDASATLMLLSEQVATQKLSVHKQVMKKKDEVERSWLVRLTHFDETKMSINDKHYLTDSSETLGLRGEAKLEEQPFIWADHYQRKDKETDGKILEKRRQVEARCANVFLDILNKKLTPTTVEEQSLIMRAISDYLEKNSATPFYNAIRLLAISYHKVEGGVSFLGSALAKDKEIQVCADLSQKLTSLFHYDHTQLTCQEKILDKRLWASIENIKPQMNFLNGCSEDDAKSDTSRVSRISGVSTYSYRSTSSAASNVRLRLAEVKANMAYIEFQKVWGALHTLPRPLTNREIKFVLKNYVTVYQNTDIDKVQSTELLNKAFDALTAHAMKATASGFFGRMMPENTKALEDYNGLMGYVMNIKSNDPFVFAHYCAYQVERKVAKEKMQACEVAFITDHKTRITSSHIATWNEFPTTNTSLPFYGSSAPAQKKLGDIVQAFLEGFGPPQSTVSNKK